MGTECHETARAAHQIAHIRRQKGGFTRRALQAGGLAAAAALAPASVQAQDASALVVLAAPPFLLSPLPAAVIRHALRRSGSGSSVGSAFVVGVVELVLWLLIASCLAVYFREKSGAVLLAVLLIACVPAVHRRFGPAQQSWLRTVASVGLFPLVWLILQVLWYGAFALLG